MGFLGACVQPRLAINSPSLPNPNFLYQNPRFAIHPSISLPGNNALARKCSLKCKTNLRQRKTAQSSVNYVIHVWPKDLYSNIYLTTLFPKVFTQ